jgi:hypothetical protein
MTFVLLILGLSLASANSTLADARAELRARGVATTAAALATRHADVPAAVDAGIDFGAAMHEMALSEEGEAWRRLDGAAEAELPQLAGELAVPGEMREPVDWATVRQVLAEADRVFAALEGVEAKLRPRVDRVRADFGLDVTDPPEGLLLNMQVPRLSDARTLAKLLSWRALEATNAGRHDELTPLMIQMIGTGDAIEAGHPMLVAHLVGISIDSITARTIQRIVPHLKIGDAPGEIPPRALRVIIGVLLDEGPEFAAWRAGFDGETVMLLEVVDYVHAGGDLSVIADSFGPDEQLMLPQWRASAEESGVAMARFMGEMWHAVDEGPVNVEPLSQTMERFNAAAPPMAAALVPSLDRAATSHLLGRNQRRLAAVALAVALYRHAEDELPPTLAALVPAYLPAVPADAMTNGSPVRYSRARGLAWTVGMDGIDHHGLSRHDRRRLDLDMSNKQLRELGTDDVARLMLPR